jgi:DMSO/TMAO reductase YedYZ molybdopterin-dependent catalytic subunit
MRKAARLTRRGLLGGAALMLGGCDRLAGNDQTRRVLASAEALTRSVHTLIGAPDALATEYTQADLSPAFRANGTTNPDTEEYEALVESNFADWRLEVGGLVERPAKFSLDALRALPSRTQITRHDCVEGWSCIGKWKGAKLAALLAEVGVKPAARFVVFHCADALERADPEAKYYESLDLAEALHPQTILAYEMNDTVLTVPHGAPLRLRAERKLGYKMAKYIMRLELVENYDSMGGGKGGYWEDLGYDWYAGI